MVGKDKFYAIFNFVISPEHQQDFVCRNSFEVNDLILCLEKKVILYYVGYQFFTVKNIFMIC